MIRAGLVLFTVAGCAAFQPPEEPRRAPACIENAPSPPICFDSAADLRKVQDLARRMRLERDDAKQDQAEAEASLKALSAHCTEMAQHDASRIAALEEKLQVVERREADRLEEVVRAAYDEAHKNDPPPLLCRDGSESDSCLCGEPRRGCCSSHGGVAGCAKKEKKK
jgi:hypothetical protein